MGGSSRFGALISMHELEAGREEELVTLLDMKAFVYCRNIGSRSRYRTYSIVHRNRFIQLFITAKRVFKTK
jgi:hypothetical protein